MLNVRRAVPAGVLALIDRNFQGFGKELFTDAGKYVIHFGDKPADAAEQVTDVESMPRQSIQTSIHPKGCRLNA